MEIIALFDCRYLAGTVEFYDKANDRITARNEKPLEGNNRIFHKVTTTDDPIVRKVVSCTFTYLAIYYLLMQGQYLYHDNSKASKEFL